MTHCRSAGHVAQLFNCDETVIRYYLKKKKLPMLIGLDPRLDKYIAQKLGSTLIKKTLKI